MPKGTCEEHHARQGFEGEVSQLYHAHPTTDWLRVEGPIRPRGIQLTDVRTADEHDARAQPAPLLCNDDITLSVSRRTAPITYYFRNADGDALLLTQFGSGTLITDYGIPLRATGEPGHPQGHPSPSRNGARSGTYPRHLAVGAELDRHHGPTPHAPPRPPTPSSGPSPTTATSTTASKASV
ncbi:hypothetical protein [Streptomyces sp. NPDC003032]